jgi:hypothetical protein
MLGWHHSIFGTRMAIELISSVSTALVIEEITLPIWSDSAEFFRK